MKKFLFILIFSLLVGCNVKGIVVNPELIVNDESISYIGIIGASNDKDAPPTVHEDVERNLVKPGDVIEVLYQDPPKEAVLKQWEGRNLITDEKFEGNSFTAPTEEGIYIYSLGSRWNFRTASNIVFVLEVRNE